LTERLWIVALNSAGELFPFKEMRYAATPATWGVAMLVPEMLFVAVVEPIQELVTPKPGAKTSTIALKFEKEARASAMVEAPTAVEVDKDQCG
jgi:hypothetical protein